MSEENKAVVRRLVEELFNTGDPDVADEVFVEDYTDHSSSNPNLNGVENVKKLVADWRTAFPDTYNTVEDLVAEGNRVAARWTTHATHGGEFMGIPPSGNRIEVTWFGIFHLSNGRIVESWDTYNTQDMLRQLRTAPSPREVLDFWFGREGEEGYGEFRDKWFTKDARFDREVHDRFGSVYEEAAAGRLESWKEEAESCLALVIVLDQFPRNMFRGDPKTYATDELAREVARFAVEHAYDRELAPLQRLFIYLPFEHSEELEDQRLSVELFRGLTAEVGSEDLLAYAVRHKEIVERFGRFPHRNEVLGRATTPEEAEFLREPGSSF